ncbi:Oidioi.mRNA.OKI2018_I69.PAR.g9789.t1.cds [Oikopleura dioica]|uniref:Oidioi.mRNA.OKI2018_I69.PAR.g9789.t1.cds n=1 Tax=Oikopleura dioica TaxID=34765 RepID=A0ABN7RQX4_OIKDI|nr:Oidioi.mRNA.OKI2018_I69.PAR.g9789.t1.cds [Oikopleura dioica]
MKILLTIFFLGSILAFPSRYAQSNRDLRFQFEEPDLFDNGRWTEYDIRSDFPESADFLSNHVVRTYHPDHPIVFDVNKYNRLIRRLNAEKQLRRNLDLR